jgi:hypothetical protein
MDGDQVRARRAEVPFADFNTWFFDLVKKTEPKIIVAIARGAVRLLQLQMVKQMLPETLITSEGALPFLPLSMLKGQKVLVFDDSLIFGSTMWEVRHYLRTRGARVTCAAYIIDRETFFGESRYPTEQTRHASIFSSRMRCMARHKLWQTPVRQHHSNLVSSILRTSGHYNLDFPSFSVKLAPFTLRDVHEVIRRLSILPCVAELRDVTSSLSANHRIYRCSILLKPEFMPHLGVFGVAVRDYSKVRVTMNIPGCEVRVTPVPQLAMKDGLKFEDVVCSDDRLTELWKTLTPPRRGDENYSRALFRLLSSFVAVLLGTALTDDLTAALQNSFQVQEVGLLTHDVEVVLGRENLEALTRIHARCQNNGLVHDIMTQTGERTELPEPCDQKLVDSVLEKWASEPRLAPHEDEFACEALAKVFLTVRAVTDNPERRKKYPYAKRLQVGLPYNDLYNLLVNERAMRMSATDLSFALDTCIDHGQVVPKILRINHTWIRAFYAGEGVDGEQLKQFALHFNKVYREFREEKSSRPLTGYDINKLGASLKSTLEWLPISSKSYTFGKVCVVGKDELPEWLTKGDKPLVATEKGHYEANPSYVFQPNLNFSSAVRPTWTPQQKRDFHDAFLYTAKAFQRVDSAVANDAKLLLSTCRTQLDAYDAFACEAHSWMSHSSHLHFGTVVEEIKIVPHEPLEQTRRIEYITDSVPLPLANISPHYSSEISPHGIDALVWCAIYIDEALKKKQIFFKRFGQLTNALRKAFYTQGREARNYWDYFIEEPAIIDPTHDKELNKAFDTLSKIVSMEARLLSYMTVLLLRCGTLSVDTLTNELKRRGIGSNAWLLEEKRLQVVAANYNKHIAYLRSRGLTSLVTRIPEEKVAVHDSSAFQSTVASMRQCYDEIGAALTKDCPERELLEGERFRFAWRFEKAPRSEPYQPGLFPL